MIKKFEILPIASAEFVCWKTEIIDQFQGNQGPFQETLDRLVKAPWNAVTAIIEEDYVDRDYQDEFSAFYSKAFKTYPSRCMRLHFFSCPISKRIRKGFGRFARHYLGFIVIRPTDLQRMGRTLLKPPIADEHREFIHCTARFGTHILGDRFTVEAMPFVQQDTQVGACAQASLWTVARYMAQRFGHREFLPSEINHLAKTKNANGRALPAEFGLTIPQMLDALEGMGFFAWGQAMNGLDDCSKHIEPVFPVNLKAKKDEQDVQRFLQRSAKLADITYRYIESGLPVILTTSDHALVAVGHTYDPGVNGTVAIERIPAWLVQDDSMGPYLEMPIFTPDPKKRNFIDVRGIIAIAPREVTLRGEEAESMAVQGIEKLLAEPTGLPGYSTWKEFFKAYRPDLKACLDKLEYRTFLMPSVEFQENLKREMHEGRFSNHALGDKILYLDFPRYIWITEISSSTLVNSPRRHDRFCLGRVIVDSTAPTRTRGQMMLHFCDFVQFLDRQGICEPIRELYPNSTPFGHKIIP